MNISTFFKHWSIRENPFIAEEARQDDVFERIHGTMSHPDFHKLLGDVRRPASAVVFGEKGSGKTAIRLQLEDAIRTHNDANPQSKSLIISYDDLNPVLDRFARQVHANSPLDALQQFRLLDHFDGLLSMIVPELVDAVTARHPNGGIDLGPDAQQTRKKLESSVRRDWVVLQMLYDRPDRVVDHSRRLRRAIHFRSFSWVRPLRWLAGASLGALMIGVVAYLIAFGTSTHFGWMLGLALLAALTLACWGKVGLDWWSNHRLAKLLHRELRVLDRNTQSFRESLDRLPSALLASTAWPVDDLDETRYAMLERLLHAVRPFGFRNLVVLVDRIDEPTLINGDTQRMKAIIWPLFNNKFLQQQNVSVKMMLPLELRHELRKQSSDFFQEARLDKQNLVERLMWSGSSLYDLCGARLNACREPQAQPISLTDLFDDSVSRQDIVDALDQMRQPRDAFKLMYQVIQEHCASTTEEDMILHIPRLTLDQARRFHAERIEELHRGLRPA